jgi:hypothetical protein
MAQVLDAELLRRKRPQLPSASALDPISPRFGRFPRLETRSCPGDTRAWSGNGTRPASVGSESQGQRSCTRAASPRATKGESLDRPATMGVGACEIVPAAAARRAGSARLSGAEMWSTWCSNLSLRRAGRRRPSLAGKKMTMRFWSLWAKGQPRGHPCMVGASALDPISPRFGRFPRLETRSFTYRISALGTQTRQTLA